MPDAGEPIKDSVQLSPEQQEDQYRDSVGVTAPVTAGEFGLTALSGVAIPYGIGHAVRSGSKFLTAGQRAHSAETISKTGLSPEAMKKLHEQWEANNLSAKQRLADLKTKARPNAISPDKAKQIVEQKWQKANPAPTVAGMAKNFLTPSLPGVAIGGLFSLTSPLNDPKYRSGDRSYLNSWWQGQKHQADQLGERGRQARENYGIAGVPVQALHGLLNPVSSLLYGGRAVRDYFSGKQASLRIARAETSVRRTLAQLTNRG